MFIVVVIFVVATVVKVVDVARELASRDTYAVAWNVLAWVVGALLMLLAGTFDWAHPLTELDGWSLIALGIGTGSLGSLVHDAWPARHVTRTGT